MGARGLALVAMAAAGPTARGGAGGGEGGGGVVVLVGGVGVGGLHAGARQGTFYRMRRVRLMRLPLSGRAWQRRNGVLGCLIADAVRQCADGLCAAAPLCRRLVPLSDATVVRLTTVSASSLLVVHCRVL